MSENWACPETGQETVYIDIYICGGSKFLQTAVYLIEETTCWLKSINYERYDPLDFHGVASFMVFTFHPTTFSQIGIYTVTPLGSATTSLIIKEIASP